MASSATLPCLLTTFPAVCSAHLLQVTDPATGQPLTLKQLVAEAGVLMFAGFETTSNALAWTLALLAGHQSCQDQVAKVTASVVTLQ